MRIRTQEEYIIFREDNNLHQDLSAEETERLIYDGYSLDDVKREPVAYNIMDVI